MLLGAFFVTQVHGAASLSVSDFFVVRRSLFMDRGAIEIILDLG